MDIDFDPFRLVLLKINLIDISSSFKEKNIKNDEITPNYLFHNDESKECVSLIYEDCFNGFLCNMVCLPKNMKLYNYTIHITNRENDHEKFTNKIGIKSALYDKENRYFKYYYEKSYPLNFGRPFMPMTGYSNRMRVPRIIYNYDFM
ncbi:hypothetical protein RF11_05619 [Thelohanellus kitauei]|uniref:Uncharacterized protein n=1 Tax=Thelohanellus kitauei TaxID=669202 RepID=A0A0C2M0K7_THEKT|nr:hypothetical protein RF11_05619 [Thelohanellus kitauei]